MYCSLKSNGKALPMGPNWHVFIKTHRLQAKWISRYRNVGALDWSVILLGANAAFIFAIREPQKGAFGCIRSAFVIS